ncbi:hypothetical protein CDV55_103327 [Aspergillus turcosus]|nr:hypothetical protein CDV55_103327 [Aspergillus turcosus]
MIIPGRALLTRAIIHNVQNPALQVQPCGVDLTLKRVLTWISPGTTDLDNQRRQTASTNEIRFPASSTPSPEDRFLDLQQGSYLVEFNETVSVPLDAMGQIFVRSSLFRSGVLLTAGVMDSGVYPSARLAQFVFYQMSEEVEGYRGVYQGRTTL